MLKDVNTQSPPTIAERRDALRAERARETGVTERARLVAEAAKSLEPGLVGAVSAVTGETAAELRRLGF